jgi:hypothetical protein
MNLDHATIKTVCDAAGIRLFESMSGRPHIATAVQSATADVTHFYDAGTLAFFGCRILSARDISGGLYLATLTTERKGFRDADGRGHSFHVHRADGVHLSPASTDMGYFSTRAACEKAMWAFVNTLDDEAQLREMIGAKRRTAERALHDADTATILLCEAMRSV